MALECWPPSGYQEHPFGVHVQLLGEGSDDPARIVLTLEDFRVRCASAAYDATSGTFLGARLEQEMYFADEDLECEFPLYRPAVNSLQDEDDLEADPPIVDLWTALETDSGTRGANWPSVASDKAAIDAVLAAMAPT